jgi:DtxR family transcriptional regulator, Mn-dependent transcriptional regulator
MEKSHNIEEILEALWVRSQEKHEEFVDWMSLVLEDKSLLKEMEVQNLIKLSDGKVVLTKKGLADGRDIIRRHRLGELLLTDILDVRGKNLIHETACGFEHLLRKGIDDKICTLLGHPDFCPHGKPIPSGKCCAKKGQQVRQIMPLTSMKSGRGGKVAYLHTRDSKELKKLMAMGLLPGTAIQLMQSFPSYVFKLGYTQFAVDKKIADEIYVKIS